MYYYGGLGYYSSMIVLIPAMIFTIIVQANIKSAFNRYSNITNSRRITGREAARLVLDSNGLTSVPVNIIGGDALTNYYDPSSNSVNLSRAVGETDSIASMCIACHEVGHAIQHAEGYAPIKIRTAIIPITNIGSKLAVPLIILGLILTGMSEMFFNLVYVGIACFSLSTLFQLVTLPTEFNASNRAIQSIEANGILYGEEVEGTKKVLTAAALTYVAALAVSLMQLLRLVLMFSRRRD